MGGLPARLSTTRNIRIDMLQGLAGLRLARAIEIVACVGLLARIRFRRGRGCRRPLLGATCETYQERPGYRR